MSAFGFFRWKNRDESNMVPRELTVCAGAMLRCTRMVLLVFRLNKSQPEIKISNLAKVQVL